MKCQVSNKGVLEGFLDDNGLYFLLHIQLAQLKAYGIVSLVSNKCNPSYRCQFSKC